MVAGRDSGSGGVSGRAPAVLAFRAFGLGGGANREGGSGAGASGQICRSVLVLAAAAGAWEEPLAVAAGASNWGTCVPCTLALIKLTLTFNASSTGDTGLETKSLPPLSTLCLRLSKLLKAVTKMTGVFL